MSWGIEVKSVFVNRITRSGLESSLEDAECIVVACKSKLRDLVMSTPRSRVVDDYSEDWMDWAGCEFEETFQELTEAVWMRDILSVAKSNIEFDGTDAIVCDSDPVAVNED